jgi:predicted DNA-binding transcriptional regulator AlpA
VTSTSWVVTMTFATEVPVEEKQLEALSDRFDELDWSVAADPDGTISATSYLDDDESLTSAVPVVIEVADRTMADVGLTAHMVNMQIMTEEYREELAQAPQLPELVAATDIAKLLGVSRQRVNQLQHDHPDFPRPVVYTGGGSLWTKYAIDRFLATWNRRPGHHREPAAAADVLEWPKRTPRARRGEKRRSKADTSDTDARLQA